MQLPVWWRKKNQINETHGNNEKKCQVGGRNQHDNHEKMRIL